jgi:hypothetical protein
LSKQSLAVSYYLDFLFAFSEVPQAYTETRTCFILLGLTMRQLFWTIAALLSLICFPATAHDVLRHHDDGRYYVNSGRYQGRIDDGRIYDNSGRYQGRVDSNGRHYDRSGRYQGRIDDNGRIYDSSGRYQGRVDANGRHYDSSGRYLGREDDNGRFYDQSGRYQGRVSR